MDATVTHALSELRYALDTFYILMSGALVMWMAAGFSMLEAGLVRAKNTTEILTKNVTLYAVACIMYMLVGYHIMYASPAGGWWPSFGLMVGSEHTAADLAREGGPTFSKMADFFFQVVFVATSMSIISGAVAERMKLWAFLIFALVMTGFIYPVQGFWHWGGGFLKTLGFVDFAGSGMVHLTGASAALAAVLLLGARSSKYSKSGHINPLPGANLPLATLGTLILWLGWFGFNGGSQLSVSSVNAANTVALVLVNTNMSAAAGLLAALIVSRVLFGKADLTMVLNGALAGLVAITAAPDTPPMWMAVMIGSVAGVLVVFAILVLDKMLIDDPVGAISVHGVSGVWGLLAVPLSNPAASFSHQFIGISVIFAWVFGTSFVVWAALKYTIGIRVSREDEEYGLDLSECGLEAYPEFSANK